MIRDSGTKICRDLVWSNLDTAFIFAALAKRELEAGLRASAQRAFGCAQCSYDSIHRFLSKVENEPNRSEVQGKLRQLRERLDFLSAAL